MKVLWFTNNPVNLAPNTLAGGWMQALEKALTASGDIELHIATRARSGDAPGRFERGGTTYYLVPDKRSLLRKRLDVFLDREPHGYFVDQYLKIVDEVQPDVIQVFGSEMDYGLICKKTRIPVVIHIQGILHPCFYQLKRFDFSYIQLFRSQRLIDYLKGSNYRNGIKTFKRRTVNEALILNVCENVMGRTEWDKSVMSILAPRARYFHGEEILRSIFFEHSWRFRAHEVIHIVSVISVPAYKGHDNITATANVLKKAGIAFKWHVIGFDTSATAFKLFYHDHMAALRGSIHFHGGLAPPAMIEILLNSCVYVHPSHIENSSNALCEAMALGVPVIALDVGGNTSLVKNKEDGLIVPDHDPYCLAAAIQQLATHGELASRLGANAKARAVARHDPERILAELKAVYSTLVNSHAL